MRRAHRAVAFAAMSRARARRTPARRIGGRRLKSAGGRTGRFTRSQRSQRTSRATQESGAADTERPSADRAPYVIRFTEHDNDSHYSVDERVSATYDFKGSVAVVTGAGSGIGLAAAEAFAEAGASVVLADVDDGALRTATDALTSAGHKTIGVACDVADEAQVAAMVERAVTAFGRLDMAFNNAGIVGPTGDLADESEESFDQVTAINLRGVWTCMKHELRQMRTQGSGAIVNTSSLVGLVGHSGRASYAATKHGVIGLTKSAALDHASHGIRINAVCPGVIETPMTLVKSPPDVIKEFVRDQPIGRLGRADEVAAAVVWLCSPYASFVLGVALPVDGGCAAH
jgi:NAD(P)-dependent dehydrogenase (short-subunit alcohol dehydrogenase family)